MADHVFAALVAFGVSGLVIDAGVKIMPKPQTSDFFAVQSVRAVRAGDTADLWVDRQIIRPVHMRATVRVLQWSRAGWREHCIAIGPAMQYAPDRVLDQPVTLDFWTWGQCPTIPEGRVQIETTWAPIAPGMVPVTVTAEVM